MSFAGRVVMVTGVGQPGQVGAAVARAFADDGAHVIAVSRHPADAAARVAELVAAGLSAEGLGADLADEQAVATLAAQVRAGRGARLDALVHTAGGFAASGPVASSDFGVWRKQFDINLTSAYLTTRAFLPALREARGAIVYFASAAALPGASVATLSAYAAAKTALITLMRAVAKEERSAGVRANALAPTAIRTTLNMASMGADEHYVEREEVAAAVLFLASPAASAISGQVVELRGK